jgi:hypothetical protein
MWAVFMAKKLIPGYFNRLRRNINASEEPIERPQQAER